MLHNDIGLLTPAMQNKANAAYAAMKTDEKLITYLAAEKCSGVAPHETLRDIEVQMAYRSRLLYTEIAAAAGKGIAESLKPTISKYVQIMYKAAGLWAIDSATAIKPNTWTMESKHLVGKAIDIVPIKDGAPCWLPETSPVWKRMGEIGEEHGLSWGGRWKNNDCPHFEMP